MIHVSAPATPPEPEPIDLAVLWERVEVEMNKVSPAGYEPVARWRQHRDDLNAVRRAFEAAGLKIA